MGILRKIFGESFKELREKELELIRQKKEREQMKIQAEIDEKNRIEEEAKRIKEEARRKRERIIQDFNDILDSIPRCEIKYSEREHSRNSVGLLPEVKFSSVTQKTIIENIANYVVVDVETTGLKATDSIIEISAIRFEDFEPLECFTSLINPNKKIPNEITTLTGITDEMVATSPKFSDIVDSFIEFIGNSIIVGHNLSYDLKMIWSNGANIYEVKHKYYDTLDLAQKTLKKIKQKWDKEYSEYEDDYESDYDVENYKLDTLCDYYGILRDDSHRSLSDSYATGIIFKNLVMAKANKE